MTDVHVQDLADLAHIDVSKEELENLERELPAILDFVEQIQTAGGHVVKETGTHYNVMREDVDPHESGVYTEALLEAMPDTENGYLKVRKIISQD